VNEALLLFAKHPRRGKVKTRLEPALGPDGALELYRALLSDALRLIASLARADRRVELCLDAPGEPPAELTEPLRTIVAWTAQGAGDLGARLARAARRCAEHGAGAVVFVGADSPTLPAARIEDAFRTLRTGTPAVFAPALDGGYVLVGCRPAHPGVLDALFDGVPWGGPRVLESTRSRLRVRALRWSELPAGSDVDEPDDLPALRRALRTASGRRAAPATARWLDHHPPTR
jgi:rSAM/selenodomain-associated transferase 1